jgi:hypothetical protein
MERDRRGGVEGHGRVRQVVAVVERTGAAAQRPRRFAPVAVDDVHERELDERLHLLRLARDAPRGGQ